MPHSHYLNVTIGFGNNVIMFLFRSKILLEEEQCVCCMVTFKKIILARLEMTSGRTCVQLKESHPEMRFIHELNMKFYFFDPVKKQTFSFRFKKNYNFRRGRNLCKVLCF